MNVLFPTLLHQFDVPTFKEVKKDLIKCVYEERRKDPKGVEVSNRGGWQSSSWGFDKGPDLLSKFLIEQLVNYFQKNRILKEGVEIRFSNWWININKKGNLNIKHNHPCSSLSGVFYLQCPKDSGNIVFESPHAFTRHKLHQCYNSQLCESLKYHTCMVFDAIPGEFFIFPSDLLHYVEESGSREDRISISFNVDFVL